MKTFFLILIIATLPQYAVCQTTYSLKQCIETAWANNLQIKQSGFQMLTAEANFNQSKNNRLPTVSASYNFGINNGRSIDPFTNGYITQELSSSNAGIGANFILYNGGRLQNLVKQTGYNLQAAKLDLEQEKNTLSLNVMLAYLQVLNNEDILTLTNTQLEITKKQVERLEILNKAGAIQPSLLYDVKGQYAGDELSIINAQNALELSKLSLSQLINIPYSKDFRVERVAINDSTPSVLAAYEASPTRIYEASIRSLALVKAADLRKQSAAVAIKVAESNYYPTVSLQGQLGTNYSSVAQRATELNSVDVPTKDYVEVNGSRVPVFTKATNFQRDKIGYFNQFSNNLNSFVGVNIQIPIFNAFQTKTLINLAKIQEKTVNNQADIIKLQLKQAVEQAHLNMTATYDRYNALNRQVKALQESFKVAEKRFTEGVIHSVDFLIAKNNLDRANMSLINARYDYLLRVKVLDFYQGK